MYKESVKRGVSGGFGSALVGHLSDLLQHLLRLQLLQGQQRQAQLVLLSEGLSHLPEEVLGQLYTLVHSQVQAALTQMLLDPARQLPSLICSGVSLVSKHHESIVSLAADSTAHTLRRMPHGVKRQEVIFSDLEVVTQVLQASLQNSALSVHIRHTEHDHCSAKVVNKVDSLGHFSSGHRQQDCPAAILTGLLILLQGHAGLCGIRGLNEDQFVSLDVLQNALLIPGRHNVLHVHITGEEGHNAIWNYS